MNIKPFVLIFTTSWGLLLLGAVAGNMLESAGVLTRENLGPKGAAVVLAVYFCVFCLMGFSIVPLALKAFIVLQIKIGNGEFFLVKWIRENERSIVYGFWTVLALGLAIALALAKDDILKQLK